MQGGEKMQGEQPPAYSYGPTANTSPYPQAGAPSYQGYGQPAPPPGEQTQFVTVSAAPQAQVMQASAASQVQDNMVISIVSIFFCCILGIIATIKASDSRDALRRGDLEAAQRQSISARKLALIAIILGCVITGVSILISIVVPLIAAASVSSQDY